MLPIHWEIETLDLESAEKAGLALFSAYDRQIRLTLGVVETFASLYLLDFNFEAFHLKRINNLLRGYAECLEFSLWKVQQQKLGIISDRTNVTVRTLADAIIEQKNLMTFESWQAREIVDEAMPLAMNNKSIEDIMAIAKMKLLDADPEIFANLDLLKANLDAANVDILSKKTDYLLALKSTNIERYLVRSAKLQPHRA